MPEVNGKVETTLTDTVISLDENNNGYIIGRAMVVGIFSLYIHHTHLCGDKLF